MLNDGEGCEVVLRKYEINAILSDEEIAKRKEAFVPKVKKINSVWLRQYRQLVANASAGAVLKVD